MPRRPRVPVPTRPCGGCPALVRPGNKSGFCWKCRKVRKCIVCDTVTPDIQTNRTCPVCRAVFDVIRGIRLAENGGPRPPDAELDGRLDRYTARAAEQVPLFDETERDEED